MKRLLAFLALALIVSVRIGSAASLTTVFTVPPTNGNDGIMFDVVADKPLTVDSLTFASFAVGSGSVEIYTKTGTFVGSEGTAASWTLVATGSYTAAQAGVALAPLALSTRVSVPGGARQGFYIKFVGGTISYSNGDGVGTLEAQDSNLKIFEGTGVTGSFGGASSLNRIPNVTVTYTPLPSSLSTAYLGGNGAAGIMFDVVATKTITVKSLHFAFSGATTANVEVYTRSGTFVGFEADPTGWTSLGLSSVTTGNDTSSVEPFILVPSVTISAGARRAFYIRAASGSISYTDGDGVGTLEAQDANLSIFEGSGISGTFGGIAGATRIPNVTLRYDAPAADTAAPKVTVVGSKNIRTSAKSVQIFGLATDDVGLTSVLATFKGKKGKTVKKLNPAGNGLFSFKLKPLPGKNRVTFVAVDAAGKSSSPAKVTVTQTAAQ